MVVSGFRGSFANSSLSGSQTKETRARTEIKNSYADGFVLNEIELTRIKDVQNDLIKKINEGREAVFEYEVKYYNGAIHSPLSLSDITSGENHGSSRVARVLMRAISENVVNGIIEVQFSDVAQEGKSTHAISYSIQAQDKDWAFVAASTMDERVKKIKMPRITRLFSLSVETLVPFTFLASMIPFILVTSFMDANHNQHVSALDDIRRTATDAIDFIYKYERFKLEGNLSKDYMPYLTIVVMFLSLGLVFLVRLIHRSIPMYNFCWGDYVQIYNRKISMFKFLFGTIALGLVLSILGSYLYSNILAP